VNGRGRGFEGLHEELLLKTERQGRC
jgi:hypothetical protein